VPVVAVMYSLAGTYGLILTTVLAGGRMMEDGNSILIPAGGYSVCSVINLIV